jgi:RNA polymerase sigma-70 factor (ECF subfamily)
MGTGELQGAELVQRALAGDASAVRPLVDVLGPVVHARVARAVVRCAAARRQGRDQRQDAQDLVQEVFVALFADDAKALRSWDPRRGMSLFNFVGMVAEHQVASILRSGRRNPWTEEPTLGETLESSVGASDTVEDRVLARDVLVRLLARLREELSPRAMLLFELLVVEERTVEDAAGQLGMTADAVYAWRARFAKVVRRLGAEMQPPALDSAPWPRTPGREEPVGS